MSEDDSEDNLKTLRCFKGHSARLEIESGRRLYEWLATYSLFRSKSQIRDLPRRQMHRTLNEVWQTRPVALARSRRKHGHTMTVRDTGNTTTNSCFFVSHAISTGWKEVKPNIALEDYFFYYLFLHNYHFYFTLEDTFRVVEFPCRNFSSIHIVLHQKI